MRLMLVAVSDRKTGRGWSIVILPLLNSWPEVYAELHGVYGNAFSPARHLTTLLVTNDQATEEQMARFEAALRQPMSEAEALIKFDVGFAPTSHKDVN